MAEIAAWLQVALAAVAIFLQLRQSSRTRRRSRRVVTRWQGFGVKWSRSVDDTDDQA
jgi:hypothetical protein